jgi:F-type H+-transporting ATPase subunit c
MRNVFSKLVLLVSGLGFSAISFAQDGAGSSMSHYGLLGLSVALAVGLATFGAAGGQGRAVAAVLEGITRNPNSREQAFVPFILGLVFMELQALLGFVIAILLLGKIV